MYGRLVMRRVNVSETRENLAELLTAVEAGEEIIIMRRDRPIPPMRTTAAQTIRELREEERY